MEPLNIFIGYDHRETISLHVLMHSIMRRATRPVAITPIMLRQLRNIDAYDRERDPHQSTDFTFSRFLTPWMAKSRVSIFLDCDMLCLTDICRLEDMALDNPYLDVLVVKHDYIPKGKRKFLDQKQTRYPCKNWSSLMVFNGHRYAVRKLTPEYINRASAMDLHQFKWVAADTDIGALDPSWNHLVGEFPAREGVNIVHYTQGGPWFPEYADCEYADAWYQEYMHMCHPFSGSCPST